MENPTPIPELENTLFLRIDLRRVETGEKSQPSHTRLGVHVIHVSCDSELSGF